MGTGSLGWLQTWMLQPGARDSTGMNERQKGKPGQEEARKEDTGGQGELGRAFKSSQGSWGIKKTIHIRRAGCALHKTLAKMPIKHLRRCQAFTSGSLQAEEKQQEFRQSCKQTGNPWSSAPAEPVCKAWESFVLFYFCSRHSRNSTETQTDHQANRHRLG